MVQYNSLDRLNGRPPSIFGNWYYLSFFNFFFEARTTYQILPGPCPLRGGQRPTLIKSYNLYAIL